VQPARARGAGGNKTVPILIGVGAVLLLTGGILIATGVFTPALASTALAFAGFGEAP